MTDVSRWKPGWRFVTPCCFVSQWRLTRLSPPSTVWSETFFTVTCQANPYQFHDHGSDIVRYLRFLLLVLLLLSSIHITYLLVNTRHDGGFRASNWLQSLSISWLVPVMTYFSQTRPIALHTNVSQHYDKFMLWPWVFIIPPSILRSEVHFVSLRQWKA